MTKAKRADGSGDTPELPAPELWTGPMAWAGAALKPVQEWMGCFPKDAVFVRGEFALTLNTPTGPGMWSQTFPKVPALIRLEGGNAVEAHAPGPDGRCWTYKLEKDGRKSRWKLYAGTSFPARQLASEAWTAPWTVEYAVVQSLLPGESNGKHISLLIRDDGSVENLAAAKDPDPND